MTVTAHYGRIGKAPPCRDVPTSFDVTFSLRTKGGGLFGSEDISLENDNDQPTKKQPGDPCPGSYW